MTTVGISLVLYYTSMYMYYLLGRFALYRVTLLQQSYGVDTRLKDGWCCSDSSEVSSDEPDHLLHRLWSSPSLITIINLYVTIRAMVYLAI